MALLLECLIQIKALSDTPRRLHLRAIEARQADASAEILVRDVAARLVVVDEWASAALHLLLDADGSVLPEWPGAATVPDGGGQREGGPVEERFCQGRQALVRRLETCSAEMLDRSGTFAGRADFTVSDLVATVFAHDTDQLGRLCRDRPAVPAAVFTTPPYS